MIDNISQARAQNNKLEVKFISFKQEKTRLNKDVNFKPTYLTMEYTEQLDLNLFLRNLFEKNLIDEEFLYMWENLGNTENKTTIEVTQEQERQDSEGEAGQGRAVKPQNTKGDFLFSNELKQELFYDKDLNEYVVITKRIFLKIDKKNNLRNELTLLQGHKIHREIIRNMESIKNE